MKKLLTLLFLLFATQAYAQPAQVGFYTRADCSTLTNAVANSTVCLQTTTTVGPPARAAGNVYVWDGAAWTLIAGGGGVGGTGTVTAIDLEGTANQITVTGASPITESGTWTLSIPTNPTLPGNTTGTFIGNLTGDVTGNVTGDLTGNVTGDVTGNVTGNVTGDVSGEATGTQANLTAHTTDAVEAHAASAISFTPDGSLAATDVQAAIVELRDETVAGTGDVTAAAAFATDNSILRADGTAKGAQATSTNATLSDAGDMVLAGTLTAGGAANTCDGTAGCIEFTQGTAPSGLGTTSIQEHAPAAVTSYSVIKPGAACTGLKRRVNAANIVTESCASDIKSVQAVLFDFTADVTIGNGAFYFRVPQSLNGLNLVGVQANVVTAGTTNLTSFQITKCVASTGNICSDTSVSMLSTVGSIDSGENSTSTAATPPVIDAANDDVATAQILRFDVTAVHATAAKGLIVNLDFQ